MYCVDLYFMQWQWLRWSCTRDSSAQNLARCIYKDHWARFSLLLQRKPIEKFTGEGFDPMCYFLLCHALWCQILDPDWNIVDLELYVAASKPCLVILYKCVMFDIAGDNYQCSNVSLHGNSPLCILMCVLFVSPYMPTGYLSIQP